MSSLKSKEYKFNQLIAYLGNKRKLLPLIEKSISNIDFCDGDLFVDLFGGTGVVSRFAKTKNFKVWFNDWEPYTEIINNVFIKTNAPPPFKYFGGHTNALKYFNNLKPLIGWFSKHYSPKNDNNPNKKIERMFYTRENASKIDAIREKLDEYKKENKISIIEFNYILASLLFQCSYRSNTSGVFKGFHNGWGGKTSTALYRIKGKLTLTEPILYSTKFSHKVTRLDANILAKKIKKAKITYIDPPYNQHPYASNYHVLNTVALNDKPKEVTMHIKKGKKAGIRDDWKTDRRSAYNYKKSASIAFEEIIKNLDTEYAIISYSSDGIIPIKKMIEISAKYGKLDIFCQKYKRYVVGNTRKSKKLRNIEFIIRISKKIKPTKKCKLLWNEIIKKNDKVNL